MPEGRTLGHLAQDHYGRGGSRLAAALATYNGLSSPDRVRAGQELRLPPREELEALARASR